VHATCWVVVHGGVVAEISLAGMAKHAIFWAKVLQREKFSPENCPHHWKEQGE